MSNDKNNIQPIHTSEEQQFQEVLDIIQLHRQAAAKAVNEEALLIYWHVGAYVSAKLQSEEWGSAVVTRLSEYLRIQDPALKGYGRRNIYNMVLFYDSYSSPAFHGLLKRIGQVETLQLTSAVQSQLPQIVQNHSAQMPKIRTQPFHESNYGGRVQATSHPQRSSAVEN